MEEDFFAESSFFCWGKRYYQANFSTGAHPTPSAREVLCSCLHDARVYRANKTSVFRLGEMGVRCAGFDAISLSFHKEMAKEKKPRGLIPLGTPQDFSLSLSFGGYQKALSRQQFLRNEIQRFRCYCKQAITFNFIPCRAANCFTRKT
jgi:hypothetical protein